MPCWEGGRPVNSVAWAVMVTEGIGAWKGWALPSDEIAEACSTKLGVNPTTLIIQSLVTLFRT